MAMLEVKDLEVYYGMIQAIKGISFEVNQGEVIALIGANGAGKTTTLQTITGMLQAKKGHILFEGQDITKVPGHKIVTMGMAHVPEGRRVFANLSVYENLKLGAYTRKDKNEIAQSLEMVYESFPRLKERRNQSAGTLSGGEQQMLAMGRALMSKPRIVLMDEPSMGLSPIFVNEIFKIIQKISAEGTTVLLVEQNAKKALAEAQERLNARCEQIKSQVYEVKIQVKSTAKNIVDETKAKGRAALYRVTEFAGMKKRLLNVRTAVKDAIVSTDRDIARTALLAKGLREAGQTVNNAFRTFADKPEVDYSQKEQKHPFTKAVLAPMKAVKKLLVSMEMHLDASIDKLDNLAMNVQFDKEKRMEQTKDKEQKAPDTEREIIYSPMVAEPQEYKYNADAFEARKTSEAKQETAGKELPKVREDKAR